MGLDKLKVITSAQPQSFFIDMLNDQLKKRPEERLFEFRFPDPTITCIQGTTPFAVWTKKGTKTFVRVDNQFIVPGGKLPPLATVETNPNNFSTGYRGLTSLLEIVFGKAAFPGLKISRIDCNADVEDVSVEHIRGSLRFPRKRKTSDVGRMRESYSNCGVQTFYVGKSPEQLRVYDKIQELKYKREDITGLPQVLTRIEFEFRERKCPIRRWDDFPKLLDIQPFCGIQFLETSSDYDFRYDTKRSVSLLTFKALVELKGAHEATRILNKDGRHFCRNFRDHVSDNVALSERIQAAYRASTKAFFENRPADVRSLYTDQPLVLDAAPPIEIPGSAAKPLLGASETEAMAIAAAGRRSELLEESRVFDQHTLSESPLFSGFCPGQQLTLSDSDPESRK